MAVLHNPTKTMRLFLDLADREVPPVVPGVAPPPVEQLKVLGTAGVEWYDRRDSGFWPFVRLPVVYLGGGEAPALVASLRDLCSGKSQGFAFRTGNSQEFGFQIGRHDRAYLVEVGIDLASYLLETAGLPGEPGRELALFRFATGMAELVLFADQLKQEYERLSPPRSPAP